MRLKDTLNELLNERDLKPITEKQYCTSIKCYSEFLGREAEVKDLQYTQLNDWLKSLKGRFQPTTIANRKKGISVVWNHLAEKGIVASYEPKRVFCPKKATSPVVSWTLDEFYVLLQAAKLLEGKTHGIPTREFMTAWLWVGLDTAFRPSDMRNMQWASVDFKSTSITLVQSKTSKTHRARISEESIAALYAIRLPVRKLVFPVTKDQMRYPLQRLYAIAKKLGFSKLYGRSIGTLRRTHATLQYEDHGAAVAAESLGHVGGVRTVYASYIDHRSIEQGRIPRHANKSSNEKRA